MRSLSNPVDASGSRLTAGHTTSDHITLCSKARRGGCWGALFGLIFFIPVFGLAVGAALGAIFGAITKTGIDKEFQQRVRDMVNPGTSALFLIVDKITPDKAIAALSEYGGTALHDVPVE